MSAPGSVRPVARVVISLRARRRGAPQRAGLHVMSSAEHDRQLPRCVQHSSHDDAHKAGSSKLSPAPVRAGSRITCFTVRRSTQLRWWGLPGEQQTAQAQRVDNLTRDGLPGCRDRYKPHVENFPTKWRPLPVWRCKLCCVCSRACPCVRLCVFDAACTERREWWRVSGGVPPWTIAAWMLPQTTQWPQTRRRWGTAVHARVQDA